MNIAVFTPTFVPTLGGAEIALYNILGSLSGYNDVKIHLFLPYMSKRSLDKKRVTVNYYIHSLPPKFVHLSYRHKWLASLYFQLYYNTFFRKLKVDVVWFNMFFPLATGIKDYFLKKNIPYVVAGRGVDIQKKPSVNYGYRLNPTYEKKIRQIVNQATTALGISRAIRDEYISLGVPSDRTIIIPNTINLERFHSITPANLQKELGIGPELKVILTVGRYTPKKGYEYIPAIVRELLKIRTDFVWLIVGNGVREKLDIEGDIAGHVRFLTKYSSGGNNTFDLPSNELVSIYKAADIFVFPTIIEGLSNVTLEAMAAGLPVITSDVPGCSDIITDNKDGILVDAGNVKKFAVEINKLWQNNEKKSSLINAADKTIQKYATSNVIRKYYEMFKTVANQDSCLPQWK